jgi:hypothetical protein
VWQGIFATQTAKTSPSSHQIQTGPSVKSEVAIGLAPGIEQTGEGGNDRRKTVTDHREQLDDWNPVVVLHVGFADDFLDRPKLLRESVRKFNAGVSASAAALAVLQGIALSRAALTRMLGSRGRRWIVTWSIDDFHGRRRFAVTEKIEPVESGGVESRVAVINHRENPVKLGIC